MRSPEMLFHVKQTHAPADCSCGKAGDIAALQAFLKPGTGRTTAEITPVSDRPAD